VKIVVLEESKKRNNEIVEMLEENSCDVIPCSGTGEFMDSVESSMPDRILLNVDAWQHGKTIYNHFRFSEKISDIPVSFYNAPENFSAITDRAQNPEDKIFSKQTELDEIISNI
jgi:PleD family two-component response regulator